MLVGKLFGWQYLLGFDKNYVAYKKMGYFKAWIVLQMKMKGTMKEYVGGVNDFRKFNSED